MKPTGETTRVKPVVVGRERANQRSRRVAVFFRILVGEVALKGVGHDPAGRFELVAPGLGLTIQPAALREPGLRRLIRIFSPLCYASWATMELDTATFDSQNRNPGNTLEFQAQEQLYPLLA